MSRKTCGRQTQIINTISKSSKTVICRTVRLCHFLKEVRSGIVLDINLKKGLSELSRNGLYALMWSLVYADAVTPRTKVSLKGFIPENFPVNKTIVIPYNDSFEVVCDYIFQTAKILANQGNIVYLIALANPISLFRYLINKGRENNLRKEFFYNNNIILINPLTLFPIRFMRLKLIKKINQMFILFYTSFFIKRTGTDYLWCFDPADIELVSKIKHKTKTIYDCVDYFSSLNPKLDEEIKRKEEQLIKKVDFFFVNSHALEKTKGKIRKPNAVVVQGFDAHSFTSKITPNSQEIIEIANVKNIFAQIPKPRVGFIGTLTYRFDFKLILSLINMSPNISFVFTDAYLPIPDGDRLVGTQELIKQIRKAKNAYFIPKTFYRSVIKEILNNFDIGIIPYDVSFDFNKYCYPMKLFEYFHMGLPVISTPIDELRNFPEFVKIGKNSEEWEKIIKMLLAMKWPLDYKQRQKSLAQNNSWEQKVTTILHTINNNG